MSSTKTLRRSGARPVAAFFLPLVAAFLSLVTVSSVCAPATAAPAAPGQLQFQANTLDGKPFNGADWAGKPVVLWFWASWCPDCAREAQTVAKVAAADPQVNFIGISGKSRAPSDDQALKQIRDFVSKYGVGGILQVTDLKGEAFLRSDVTEIPTFVFLKPNGTATSLAGEPSAQDLADRARQTLS